MIEIWHAKHPTFGLRNLPDRPTPVWPLDFTMVACVSTDDLDEAYRLTNHIDTDWLTNEFVLPAY